MDVATAMRTLESKGKSSVAKTYARHGVIDPAFGVSYADFTALAKKIGVDHELALALWKSGVHDARILATRIADPARMTRREIERWIGDVSDHGTAGAVACVAARMEDAGAIAREWMDSSRDLVASSGWTMLGVIAQQGRPIGTDARELLKRIRTTIHSAPNRTRHAMNMALIGIGGTRPELRDEALAVARAIGKVEVDHGDTECETPDAAAYIKRMAARADGRSKAASRRGR